ncbi:DNA recombination protein RmuC [Spirochaetota bacterium]
MGIPININTVLILVLIILVFVSLFVIVLLKLKKLQELSSNNNDEVILKLLDNLRQDMSSSTNENRKEVQQKFDTVLEQLNKTSKDNYFAIQSQFDQSKKIISEVTERLTKIDETNKQVLNFSGQMQSLENILKNPKQRGVLGEYFLETLLGNVLQPNQYKMQYKFKSGEIVDAAIFYRDLVIPVDAKFSLEKYNMIMQTSDEHQRAKLEKEFRNDVKMRIDETAKYVRPKENTTEFAFMFIPAEGVYYNLLIYNVGSVQISVQDLIEYAFKKHVIIVSPTSFYAYLETVLQGIKAQSVEENVKEIIKRINDLNKHMVNYEDFLRKMGKNLQTTVSSYNNAYKEFRKIDNDIYKITEGESGGKVDPLLVDKPASED